MLSFLLMKIAVLPAFFFFFLSFLVLTLLFASSVCYGVN